MLEQRAGNFGRARKLFDAALVADRRLSSAWHGWAVLELKDGNVSKARDLIRKGIKLGEPSAYLYQVCYRRGWGVRGREDGCLGPEGGMRNTVTRAGGGL